LASVVDKVKSLLSSGSVVSLCGRSQSFSHQVYAVRVDPSGLFLRVKTLYGWSSVWYSEYLIDESGVILFETPEYEELDDELLDDAILHFINEFGILPWCKGVNNHGTKAA
jgi:hypothetical protein